MIQNLRHEPMDAFDIKDFINENLIGKRLLSISDEKIVTTDGIEIEIETNEGCGGCGNGWSSVDFELQNANLDAAIMNVSVESVPNSERYILFIYMADNSTMRYDLDEGWGNGYYGGGFYLTVKNISTTIETSN